MLVISGALGKAELTFVTVFSTLIQHTKVPCHNNYEELGKTPFK